MALRSVVINLYSYNQHLPADPLPVPLPCVTTLKFSSLASWELLGHLQLPELRTLVLDGFHESCPTLAVLPNVVTFKVYSLRGNIKSLERVLVSLPSTKWMVLDSNYTTRINQDLEAFDKPTPMVDFDEAVTSAALRLLLETEPRAPTEGGEQLQLKYCPHLEAVRIACAKKSLRTELLALRPGLKIVANHYDPPNYRARAKKERKARQRAAGVHVEDSEDEDTGYDAPPGK